VTESKSERALESDNVHLSGGGAITNASRSEILGARQGEHDAVDNIGVLLAHT